MKLFEIALVALTLVALFGCKESSRTSKEQPMSSSAAAASSKIPGFGPDWELVPHANYTASQTPGEVIIKATGENPTAGYETLLVDSMLRIWPPEFRLARKKPEGMAAQVITPFEVVASFKATDPIPQVVVHDAAGRHEIKVDQARD